MQGHDAWLKIAQEDLQAAKALLKIELFSTVTYHTQQSAEKALKAYLVWKKQPIIKTHDLIQLIELCMKFDRGFEKIFMAANTLNPYSTKFRYPSEQDIPDVDDAKAAIKLAKTILMFVTKKISLPQATQFDLFESDE